MAEIIVKYNTVDKKLEATKDGKASSIKNITFYEKYDKEGEFSMEATDFSKDEENDMHEVYRCMCEQYDKDKVVEKAIEYLKTKLSK